MRKPAPVVRHTQLKSTALIALAFMAWTAALCNAASVIPAGEQITVHSEILGEDRTVFVALPASYRSGAERYPVLYLTDASGILSKRGPPASIWRETALSRK